MKTQKTTHNTKRAVYSGSLGLTLASIISAAMFAFPAAAWSQTAEWTVYNTANSGLPYNTIAFPLATDAQGNVWIGTGDHLGLGGGLAKFDGENWTVYTTENSGLPCNNLWTLALDAQENLWIGTCNWHGEGGGLAKFDGENWTVYNRLNSGLPYNDVWALAFDAQGNVWIGTSASTCGVEGGGLAKFDGENWTVYNKANSGLTSNDVWALAFDTQGNLWAGTGDDEHPEGGGLAKFDGENWTVYHTSNSPLTWHMVISLAFDAQENLWMGMWSTHTTTGGVAMFDGENWWVFNEWNSGLPYGTATGLAFDAQGNLWIGTYGGGLAVYRIGEGLPVVDFNGDGIVDIKDLLRLIQSWGQDDPMVDIAPLPFGNGVVDALDLELLMSYWGQPVDDPTLIAHWALDETESIVAHDSAGNNYALIIGDPLWQPSGGQVDGALQLDGVDDCAITGSIPNPAEGPFSVFAWIRGGAPGQAVLSQMGGARWLCADPSEGNLMTELMGAGRDATELLSQTIITDGDWRRIGLVWDGSHRTLYVDDVAVAQDAQPDLVGSESGLYIGAGTAMEPGSFFSGLIDDVRIYNRAVRP